MISPDCELRINFSSPPASGVLADRPFRLLRAKSGPSLP